MRVVQIMKASNIVDLAFKVGYPCTSQCALSHVVLSASCQMAMIGVSGTHDNTGPLPPMCRLSGTLSLPASSVRCGILIRPLAGHPEAVTDILVALASCRPRRTSRLFPS